METNDQNRKRNITLDLILDANSGNPPEIHFFALFPEEDKYYSYLLIRKPDSAEQEYDGRKLSEVFPHKDVSSLSNEAIREGFLRYYSRGIEERLRRGLAVGRGTGFEHLWNQLTAYKAFLRESMPSDIPEQRIRTLVEEYKQEIYSFCVNHFSEEAKYETRKKDNCIDGYLLYLDDTAKAAKISKEQLTKDKQVIIDRLSSPRIKRMISHLTKETIEKLQKSRWGRFLARINS